MKLMSWNIYFDDKTGNERYPEILSFLSSEIPDFICLQEVTPTFLKLLSKSSQLSQYHLSKIEENKSYQNIILSLFPILSSTITPLPGKLGRQLNMIEINYQGKKIGIGTVHLESYPQDTAIRLDQLQTVLEVSKSYQDFILAGDMNFGDEEEENREFKNYFIDCGENSPAPTFDIELNKIASQSKFPGERSRRLDRIFTRGILNFSDYERIINQSSDHFPIKINFSI